MQGTRSVTALLTVLLLTIGCAHHTGKPTAAQAQRTMDTLESFIRDTVKDPVRAERLAGLARQADEQAQELTKLSGEYQRRLKELNADYGAARDDFATLEKRYTGDIRRLREQILTTLFSMKDNASKDEWKKLAQREAKALMERLRAGG